MISSLWLFQDSFHNMLFLLSILPSSFYIRSVCLPTYLLPFLPSFISVLYLMCSSSQLSWKACHENKQIKQERRNVKARKHYSQSKPRLGRRLVNQLAPSIPFQILLLLAILIPAEHETEIARALSSCRVILKT